MIGSLFRTAVSISKPFMPKGATGVAVRTLVELAFSSDTWK